MSCYEYRTIMSNKNVTTTMSDLYRLFFNTMSDINEIAPFFIPPCWFNHILDKKGKPYLPAMFILADIIYTLMPIRDPKTGQLMNRSVTGTGQVIRNKKHYEEKLSFSASRIELSYSILIEMNLLQVTTINKTNKLISLNFQPLKEITKASLIGFN